MNPKEMAIETVKAVKQYVADIIAPVAEDVKLLKALPNELDNKIKTQVESLKELFAAGLELKALEYIQAEISKIPAGDKGDKGDSIKGDKGDKGDDGRPGEDGRDALDLAILPTINEGKIYPRGTFATHNGGLWCSHTKTEGMRGWECIVDGVGQIDIQHDGERKFTIDIVKSSGQAIKKEFQVPVMIYKGVFSAEEKYLRGDTVTFGGSIYHCNKDTEDRPAAGSKAWTLAAKRGRDGGDAKAIVKLEKVSLGGKS